MLTQISQNEMDWNRKAEMKPWLMHLKNNKQNLEDTVNIRNKFIRQTTLAMLIS